jgi:hypothetical protein
MMTEAEITGAINGGHEVALETEIVQGFHADEPLGVLTEQLSESGTADVPDEMIESFGDRQAILLGACQEVKVVEDGQFEIPQVIIGGTAAAQA